MRLLAKIHRLDSLTIDQIAAGEVIEAPASCIKELVENSLDAGATHVVVEAEVGGRELIRVVDDGCGMCRSDVLSSIERHATSKLQTIDDLERLSSLGFRGEALASIASVAHMTITSAEADGSMTVKPAATLMVEGGTVRSVIDTQACPGTTVEVKSLFYNVPARRKFLKTPARDAANIIKTMTSIALAAPKVSFRLIIDGKEILSVQPGQTFVDRTRSLLGEAFRHDAFEVQSSRVGCSVAGLVADPRHARSTRSGQYLIVNGRAVYSLPLSYAVRMAYGTACEDKKHPQYALSLVIDPSCIDVNVHPQKRELRFSDEEGVKESVRAAVSQALFGKGFQTFATPCAVSMPMWDSEAPLPEQLFEDVDRHGEMFSPDLVPQRTECCAVVGDVAILRTHHGAMLLFEIRRALREALVRELEASAHTPLTEPLLIPVPIECSAQEATRLSLALPELEHLGFVVRPFGPCHFLVEGVPSHLSTIDVAQCVLDIVHGEMVSEECWATHVRYSKLANTFVGTMKDMRHPISSQTALAVYTRWESHGCPPLSSDGKPCAVAVTQQMLSQLILDGSNRGLI